MFFFILKQGWTKFFFNLLIIYAILTFGGCASYLKTSPTNNKKTSKFFLMGPHEFFSGQQVNYHLISLSKNHPKKDKTIHVWLRRKKKKILLLEKKYHSQKILDFPIVVPNQRRGTYWLDIYIE